MKTLMNSTIYKQELDAATEKYASLKFNLANMIIPTQTQFNEAGTELQHRTKEGKFGIVIGFFGNNVCYGCYAKHNNGLEYGATIGYNWNDEPDVMFNNFCDAL